MAKVLWITNARTGTAAGATDYSAVAVGGWRTDVDTSEANHQNTIHTPGTFTNLYAKVSANAASSNTTVRFRKNTSDGNQNLTIGSGATGEFEDTTNNDAVVDGDEVSYRIVGGLTGSTTLRTVETVFEANSGTSVILQGAYARSISTASNTAYWGLSWNGDNGNTTEAQAQTKIATAGTLKNLFLNVSSNGRSTTTTFGSRVAGADGTMTISVGSGATGIFEDASNTDAITAGQLVGIKTVTSTGVGSLVLAIMAVEFTTTNNTSLLPTGASDGGSVTTGVTTFGSFGDGTLNTTESNKAADAQINFVVSNLWAYISANATTSPSTIDIRKNSASGNTTVSIGSGATGEFEDSVNSDTFLPHDTINYRVVNGGGGTLTFRNISFKVLSQAEFPGNYMLPGIGF